MTSNKKFIAWDWNGTLQDDFHISIKAANRALKTLGKVAIDEATYRECFDVPIDRMYRNLGLNDDEVRFCLVDLKDSYFELYDEMVVSVDFRPGARDILDFATSHGIAHVVLSNHLKDSVEKDLARLNKRGAFHEVLAWPNRETQFAHPKADFLSAYMAMNDLAPQDGLIVGDTVEEIRIARSLGLTSVAIAGGYTSLRLLEEAQPDAIIHDLLDLAPILRRKGFAS